MNSEQFEQLQAIVDGNKPEFDAAAEILSGYLDDLHKKQTEKALIFNPNEEGRIRWIGERFSNVEPLVKDMLSEQLKRKFKR